MWTFLATLTAIVALANGHGRVLKPPGRGTVWRLGYAGARANYDDDGLNCGGYYHHHSVNKGKCGVCGDPYDASEPRAHERGGIYDSGIITETYEAGSIVPITVFISAHHRGYWEFKICPDPLNNNQECFDQYLLELEEGGTKYYPPTGGSYVVNYKIPADLSCDNCVLQWRYTAGNNWGVCSDGTQALGCGNQETFGACSDIAITGGNGANQLIIPEWLLINDSDILKRLMLSGLVRPYHRVPSTGAPPRKNSKRRKHKGKKKVKPYKSKWPEY